MHLISLVPSVKSEIGEEQKPVIKHECKVIPEIDVVEKYIQGHDVFSRFNRWFTRKRMLSPKQYYAQTCLKSTTAIKYEMLKHLKNYRYMIHPFSPLKNGWDLIMLFVALTTLVLTPFLNTFYHGNQFPIITLITIIDFILLLDVFVQFFTGCYDKVVKSVTLEPRTVFINYIKGFFFLDFISSLPIELIDYLILKKIQVGWFCSTLNLVKIIRLRNVLSYLDNQHKMYHVSFRGIRVLQLLITTLICLHWTACLVYYIPLVITNYFESTDKNVTSWILTESMKKRKKIYQQYNLCLNRATISLVSGTHYLIIETAEDMIMNISLAVLGKLGYIYLLTQFFQLMSVYHTSNKERLRLLQQLQEYMQYKELPRVMQKRLLSYYNYWYKKNFNRDMLILDQVSGPLREQLIFHNYTRLLESVEIFQNLPSDALTQLVMFIHPEIYLTTDVIVKSGTSGDSLFFIGSGTVAVYTSFGKEVCHLEDGSYFGEISLIIDNERRIATIIAIETCEIWTISRDDFQRSIESYPDILNHLQKVAFEKLSKTVPMDEIYIQNPNLNYINISDISRINEEYV